MPPHFWRSRKRRRLPPGAACVRASPDGFRWPEPAGRNRWAVDHRLRSRSQFGFRLPAVSPFCFAEFIGLARLALANDLGRRLEQAEDLAFGARIMAEDARPGLFHHLLDARYHRVDLLTQAFQPQLLHDVRRSLDAVGDLLGEPLCLTHHAAG